MKTKFHLYSVDACCKNCKNLSYKGSLDHDILSDDSTYCHIIGSVVEPDYYCDFYRRKKEKPKKNETDIETDTKDEKLPDL
jgi:hypothetical protein